ncbi:MAG: S-adenosylmethionine decarboxylase [Candidatus Aenigmatarchaeota archaeon]
MSKKPFGWELCVDLYGCKYEKIRSGEYIEKFIRVLCADVLKVKREGKPVLKRYGKEHLTGYSFMQLIEVSSIVGHFSEERLSAHIDIFSCAPFNDKNVEKFTREFFEAKKSVARKIIRK